MRSSIASAMLLFLACTSMYASAASYPNSCTGVERDADAPYGGKVLRSSPDIASSDIHEIDAVMNVLGCLGVARELLDVYRSAHPEDYMVAYPQARIAWLGGDPASAERILRQVLREHPDFTSAKVLLGALLLPRDPRASEVLINGALAAQPNDLWANIGVFRVQFALSHDKNSIAGLLAFAKDPSIPSLAREAAAGTVAESNFTPLESMEEALAIQLTFDSRTPREGKLVNLANLQIEYRGQYKEGEATLSPLLNRTDDYCCKDVARRLFAEAYLLEAASIDPNPSKKNESLVLKAKEMLGGDLSELAPRVPSYTHLRPLLPFLKGVKNPSATDADGSTALCNAVQGISMSTNRKLAEAALELGSDTEVVCNFSTPLGELLGGDLQNPAKFDDRIATIKMLLDHGANPNPPTTFGMDAFTYCEGFEYCEDRILPLLKSYAAKRKIKTQ